MTIREVTKFNFAGGLYDTKEEAMQARAKSQLTILIQRLVDKNANIQQCQVPEHIVENLLADADARKRLVEIMDEFNSITTTVNETKNGKIVGIQG